MLAKLTAKNQLTLPKAVVDAVGLTEYFDLDVHAAQIVLRPVRIQRGDAMRAKLAALGLSQDDVSDAVRWARSSAPAAQVVAEPVAPCQAQARPARKPKAAPKPRKPGRA